MKHIVLFVEGEGEAEAVPNLVKRLLSEQDAWKVVALDPHPFRVGEANRLVKNDYQEWKNKLKACIKRQDVGGVLLVLDGDVKKVGGRVFCTSNVAKSLADHAKHVGGGKLFSVAVVFARQEYESWLIAGVESLAGQQLPDGRRIRPHVKAPDGDLEESPRDAKGWFNQIIDGGYRPTLHQAALTKMVDLATIRNRKLRSFRRLENALGQLVSAVRCQQPIVSPC